MSICEWDPENNCPATGNDGCRNMATLSVGANGQWHLCESCASLPGFRALPVKPLFRPPLVPGNTPLTEILGKKLLGIESVPADVRQRMIQRAVKAVAEYEQKWICETCNRQAICQCERCGKTWEVN